MVKRKAGCVPVRRRQGSSSQAWEVLLVQSRWTPQVWLFPKGTVEEGEEAKQAAARETCEEGGVIGSLGTKLGAWVTDPATKQKLKMWLLYVTTEYGPEAKQWKERKKRLRAWHTFDEARAIFTGIPTHIQRPHLIEILDATQHTLQGGGSQSRQSNGSSD